MGIIRDLYYARKISAGAKLPAPTVALLIKRLYLASRMGGGEPGHQVTVTGTLPMVITNAVAEAIHHLTRYGLCAYAPGIWNTAITQEGKCVQDGTPTPDAPMDIVTNNGALRVRRQSGLPLGYQRVEYIEGDGTAYIDTGVLLSNTDVFEITFQSLNVLASPVMGAISGGTSFTSTNNLSVTYTTIAGLSAYSVYCDGAAGNVNYSWNGGNRSDGLKHTIKYNGLNIAPMLDGVAMTQVTSKTLVENTPTVTTWLFGRNSTSTGTLAQSGVRIFDFNIQSKGHFIPARRNSDNVLGMYDLVSGQFLTNAGTGSFTAGEVVDDPVEIYTDGTDEVLTITGKNLLDPSTSNIYINQHYNANGVIINNSVNNWRSGLIPIVGGKTYSFCGRKKIDNTISAYNRINWYAADGTHIAPRPSYTVNTVTIATAPSNAAFAGLSCSAYDSDAAITRETFDEFNWMFAEASTEIPYQPYVAQQTASVPMLLGVGDSKDEGELISGLLTHKVGIMVFDGTEDWGASSSANIYILASAIGVGLTAICTHFNKVANSTSAVNMPDGSFKGHSSNSILYFKDEDAGNVDGFKARIAAQYAAGTPVIMLYKLATETTEQGTAYPQLCNQLYDTAEVTANVSDISVTFTTGEQTEPNQYSPLDILCNNGALVWNGSEVVAVGTPEQLTVRPGMHLRLTGADFEPGTINDETGADVDNNNDVRTSGYIDVVPGESYAIYWKLDDSLYATSVDLWLYYYDAENNLIGVFEDDSTRGPERRGYSFTAAADCVKMRVSGKMTDTFVTPSDVVYLGIDTIGTAATSPAGKNLFCFETSMFGKQIQSSGAIADLKTNLVSDFIEVEAGVRYVLSGYAGNVAENNIRIGFYGADKSQIGNIRRFPNYNANLPFVGSFLVPENGKYMRFTMPIACSDVMLERGATQTESDTRTEYEPYWDESWQTASVVDLLAVGDDHKDDQDLVNGAVHRRTSACRYDGTQPVGDVYMSTTGGKDIGAIIVYPVDLDTESATPQPLTLWEGTNQIDSVANVGPLTAQIKYYAATAQDVLSALLGTTVGPTDISTQDAETMINVITGGDT